MPPPALVKTGSFFENSALFFTRTLYNNSSKRILDTKEEPLTSQEARRRLIVNILKNEKIHSQEELQQRLKQEGKDVTQATLSRDLKFLGIARIPDRQEGYVYTIKEEVDTTPEPYLHDDIARGIVDVQFSANLAVVHTKLGHGHSVAFAIDRLEIPEVLGTLGGEDTLLVIFREDADKSTFIKRLTGEDTLPTH
jgi:transcriptional regulator of arginine metabolism